MGSFHQKFFNTPDNFCADNTAMTALDFHYLQFARIGNFLYVKTKKQPSEMDDCKKYQ